MITISSINSLLIFSSRMDLKSAQLSSLEGCTTLLIDRQRQHIMYYLPTELLIHQCVHNWVHSGIEHNNCGLRDISCITRTKDRRQESHKVSDSSRHPTHSKYDTDRDDHKSDFLPYPQHTLMTKRTINKC